MSFGQSIECRNWCWMSNIFYCYLFLTTVEFYNSGHIQGINYKGALTQKRSFLLFSNLYYFHICFSCWLKNQNKHLTLNLSFDALSKWHEPVINVILICKKQLESKKQKKKNFWGLKLSEARSVGLMILRRCWVTKSDILGLKL